MGDPRDTETIGSWRSAETVDTLESVQELVTARLPTLTILHHPQLERVGERARLALLTLGKPVSISRLEPLFSPPGRESGRALADPRLSRQPVRLDPTTGGGIRLDVGGTSTEVAVDGEPVRGWCSLSPVELDRGVVVELAKHFVLLLHRLGAPPLGGPSYGIVGANESMERLRGDIRRVADVAVPVLLRGESGTGKELVARAIHDASPRAGAPWLSVNMAAINPSTAASELFGHRRGAFTGADRDHPGYFRRADGGTLFMDEIGETPPELQAMLLRVLETGEVQPVGAARTARVDVRLVAATDADLEAECRAGRFRAPLLHRLSGYEITIPPLRDRRDDIARLFVHFLRQELQALGEAGRLDNRTERGSDFLPAGLVARLCRFPWPGNVRQLRNVARQIVISSRGSDVARVDPSVERMLAGASTAPRPHEAATPPPAPSRRGSRTRPAELSEDELIDALRKNQWRLGPTASALAISRTTLYALIEKSDRVRKARDLTAEQILDGLGRSDQNVGRAAAHLEVSKRGLQLRMRELGLTD